MNHKDAEDLQKEWDLRPDAEDAGKYISSELIDLQVQALDAYQQALESNIADYSLDRYEDLLDTEERELVRMAWFSKGVNDYCICYTSTGLIASFEDVFPPLLLVDIANVFSTINYRQSF